MPGLAPGAMVNVSAGLVSYTIKVLRDGSEELIAVEAGRSAEDRVWVASGGVAAGHRGAPGRRLTLHPDRGVMHGGE